MHALRRRFRENWSFDGLDFKARPLRFVLLKYCYISYDSVDQANVGRIGKKTVLEAASDKRLTLPIPLQGYG